ncbi:MAG: hypothetical protein LBK13_04630 [Spirochaetales bacterium]|jgi:hypothetical protein|nr:hypothetical protein [Spirochaetales bacterium]
MDLSSLLNNLIDYTNEIDAGRTGFSTAGKEGQGRILYESGVCGALKSFQEAQVSKDPQTLILCELIFLQQEMQFCDKKDEDTRSSLTQAIQSFEDALRCLKTVENPAAYRFAETAFPISSQYRIHGFPKDAFHLACISHRTRLRNVLRAPGINMIEKNVLNQRAANMNAAQNCYSKKQKKSLEE